MATDDHDVLTRAETARRVAAEIVAIESRIADATDAERGELVARLETLRAAAHRTARPPLTDPERAAFYGLDQG